MENLENLSKSDLIKKLQILQEKNTSFEDSTEQLQKLVKTLQSELKEQSGKCQILEEDKASLRNNIQKASVNWFEKKARLSDSDNDQGRDPDSREPSPEQHLINERNQLCLLSKDEAIQVFSDLKFKTNQLELVEHRSEELCKRLKDYERVIDDQEIIIHGMKDQLDMYFDDNQKMCKQLKEFTKIFQELEAINVGEVIPPSKTDVPSVSSDDLPSKEDFQTMSGSVSKTYLKLKELIYEKKSLVTEIERLRTLNVELQHRVSHQENRLMSVSDALQTTWLLVSNLKDTHEKIHTNESILRYQLREKREILQKLREELESSREQWHIIRQKNTETEQEWTTLRRELNERRRAENMRNLNQSQEEESVPEAVNSFDTKFEPPIDLLLDMGIECGAVDADDEEPTTCIALIVGEDVHADRLQNLEDQCCQLYQKLMTSTSRALTLASRLTTLHEHYAMSDEDDDEEYLEDEEDEDMNGNIFESVVSLDSESYDTAYVSEPDINDANSTTEAPASNSSDATPETSYPDTGVEEETSPYDSSHEYSEEACDLLSKRLINFLPKKIELLRADNKKMEEKYHILQEEKLKMEAILSASVEFERRQRKQLEEQLSHLGKYVDELKLERNGKIAKIEETLRKKMDEVQQQEMKHHRTEEELESLKAKYDDRGQLLQLTALQLQQSEERAHSAEEALNKFKHELECLHKELDKFRVQDCGTKIKSLQNDPRISVSGRDSTSDNLSKIPEPNPASETALSGVKNIVNHLESRSSAVSLPVNIYTFSNPVYLPSHLIISKETEFRLPFQLEVGSVLNWEFQVSPQGIRFFICYDQWKMQNSPSYFGGKAGTLPDGIIQQVSNLKLINPVYVGSAESNTKGRITPRIPGQFCLVFCNPLSRTQEIRIKVWLENVTADLSK